MKQILLLASLTLMVFTTSQAQEDSVTTETLAIYVTGHLALPSEEFRSIMKNSIGNLAIGANAGVLLSPFGRKKPSPIMLGADFCYLNYGVDKIDGTSTIPPLKITYNVITWNGVVRVRPPLYKSGFTPFADGMIGVKLLNTVTKVDKDVTNILLNTDQPEVLDRVNNTGLNYGLGAGFILRPKKDEFGAAFTLRLLYFWGDAIKYIVRGTVSVDSSGFVTYQTNTVNTSMLVLQFGINFSNIRKAGM